MVNKRPESLALICRNVKPTLAKLTPEYLAVSVLDWTACVEFRYKPSHLSARRAVILVPQRPP
ncbi:MAG TPA: hypothetical protein PKL84_09445 [Candidatus Hydrogenedentes bacterium]|nr:hypothetical protein [Candidatus Hydrogenedentota bacterium]